MRFNKCMGLPINGFEEEIVDLVTRISDRRYTDKGKGVQGSTKFDRELKRLEWIINEKERSKDGASGKGARGFFNGCL